MHPCEYKYEISQRLYKKKRSYRTNIFTYELTITTYAPSLVPCPSHNATQTKARHAPTNGFFHIYGFNMAESMVSNVSRRKSFDYSKCSCIPEN